MLSDLVGLAAGLSFLAVLAVTEPDRISRAQESRPLPEYQGALCTPLRATYAADWRAVPKIPCDPKAYRAKMKVGLDIPSG